MKKHIKTNLNTEIEKLLKKRGMKWTHLISKDIFAAAVDAWKSGERVTVSPKHRRKLAKILCVDEVEKGGLLKAILEDQRHGPGKDSVSVIVQTEYRHHPFNPTL
jgi:hypothetical protein